MDAAKFKAAGFSHSTTKFPLTGRHESLECAKCHTRSTAAAARPGSAGADAAGAFGPLPADCRSCHADEHLGQVDARCETCHSTSGFKMPAYKHRSYEQFFAGNHGKLACGACHKKETGVFPAGPGTAVRLKVGTACVACHNKI